MGRICRRTASKKKPPRERVLHYNPAALMEWLVTCHRREQQRKKPKLDS